MAYESNLIIIDYEISDLLVSHALTGLALLRLAEYLKSRLTGFHEKLLDWG